MAVGKGGSSGSQSGTNNSQTAGNSSSANLGVAMPIAPGGYEDAWRSMLGTGGNTPGQSAAANFFTGTPNDSLLNPAGNGWYGAVGRNNKLDALTTPGGFQQAYGAAPQSGGAGQVSAQQGAAFMQPYQQGYTNDVVNATTNDLMNQYGKAQNASNMAGTAAGGFANSRMGLRDAQVQDDFLRTLGTTSAGLRDQGFSRAMQGGQFDAGQALQASGQNAQNTMANNQFNAQLQNQRDQFSAQSMMQAIQNQMGNSATAAGIGTNAANSAAGIGGNVFGQGLAALGAGGPLFGQSNLNVGANDAAGNSASQTSGKNSSKGGGASFA